MGNETSKVPYISPKLVDRKGDLSKRWYIEFYAFNAELEKLQRKQLFLPSQLKTAKDRKAWANEQIKNINELLAKGYHIKPKKASPKPESAKEETSYTFLEAIKLAVEIKKSINRKRTSQSYNSYFTIFSGWLADTSYTSLPVKSVSNKHIYEFLDYLKTSRKIGNRMYNNYLEFLKTVFNTLIQREIIHLSPCRNIPKLPTETGRNIAFTPEERNKIEGYLLQHDKSLYLFTRFIYYAFLRPLELLQLQIRHIDLKNRLIIVPGQISKNKKQQTVTIIEPLAQIIQGMNLDKYPSDYLLFGKELLPGTKQLIRNRVSERHKAVLDSLQLQNLNITLYSWKHTGVVNAYRYGNLDIKTLQQMLRHHSLEMTDIYLKSLGLSDNKDLQGKSW